MPVEYEGDGQSDESYPLMPPHAEEEPPEKKESLLSLGVEGADAAAELVEAAGTSAVEVAAGAVDVVSSGCSGCGGCGDLGGGCSAAIAWVLLFTGVAAAATWFGG
jgi:hypothetical protein